MVLVSHRYRFIFFKTIKTAGSSVEAFFEPWCMPPGAEPLPGGGFEGAEGIVGHRGRDASAHRWQGHMPARDVRALLSDDVWSGYLKFCACRDPFDRVVSLFHFRERQAQRGTAPSGVAALFAQLDREMDAPHRSDTSARFRRWVALGGADTARANRHRFSIDGEVCIDDAVRFEQLDTEVRRIADRLGLDHTGMALPRLKVAADDPSAPPRPALTEYYDAASRDHIVTRLAAEFTAFNYPTTLPE